MNDGIQKKTADNLSTWPNRVEMLSDHSLVPFHFSHFSTLLLWTFYVSNFWVFFFFKFFQGLVVVLALPRLGFVESPHEMLSPQQSARLFRFLLRLLTTFLSIFSFLSLGLIAWPRTSQQNQWLGPFEFWPLCDQTRDPIDCNSKAKL